MKSNQDIEEQRLDEASEWLVRLRSDAVTGHDKQGFSRWLNEHPSNEQAFDKVMKTWETLGAAAYTPAAQRQQDIQKHGRDLSPIKRWSSLAAMAACAMLVAALTLLPDTPSVKLEATHTYITKAGEFKRVELEDGSIIELNTRSQLDVTFSEEKRQLSMLQGEAFFSVASDKTRPFVVNLKRGTVTAIGTEFNINHSDKRSAMVTVNEGVVELREHPDAATPRPRSVSLYANQALELNHKGLSDVKNVKVGAALAWRERTAIFSSTPLPEAISELNRYLEFPVDGSDPSLRSLRVSGTFRLDSPQQTLNGLMASFKLETVESDTGKRLYRPAE